MCGLWPSSVLITCGGRWLATPSAVSEEGSLPEAAALIEEPRETPEARDEALTEETLRVAHLPSLRRKDSAVGFNVEVLVPSRMASSEASAGGFRSYMLSSSTGPCGF